MPQSGKEPLKTDGLPWFRFEEPPKTPFQSQETPISAKHVFWVAMNEYVAQGFVTVRLTAMPHSQAAVQASEDARVWYCLTIDHATYEKSHPFLKGNCCSSVGGRVVA